MKIKEVKISEILEKKYWVISEFDEKDLLNSKIIETQQIKKTDIILHSAIMVEKDGLVYPVLVSKYYEDGGEIGEYFIYLNDKWQILNQNISFKNEILGTYYSYISTKDIHEYQSGSFDNRKENYKKFEHYSSQIGKSKVIPFIEKTKNLSNRVIQLTIDEKIQYLKTLLIESENLAENGKVALGNKKVTEAIEIVKLLKNDNEGCSKLLTLLSDENKHIRQAMMYQLLDLDKKKCIKMIKKVAKEESIEGLAARMNLITIKKNGKLT